MDEAGNEVRESNARIVRWTDGSMSLYLGGEIFDINKQILSGEYSHLFVRQGQANHHNYLVIVLLYELPGKLPSQNLSFPPPHRIIKLKSMKIVQTSFFWNHCDSTTCKHGPTFFRCAIDPMKPWIV